MDARREFGDYLRAERELRRIPLAEVAEATKIPVRALESLEEGQWDGLPAMIFVRGFVQSYGRHLGIEQEAGGRFRDAVALAKRKDESRIQQPVGDSATAVGMRRRFGLALFVIILLIIVTITFSVLWGGAGDESPRARLDDGLRTESDTHVARHS
jgi:cytoskeletal protein RodZ